MIPAVTFAQPLFFWALAVLPVLAAFFLVAERARRVALDRLLAARLQPRLAGSVSVGRRRLAFALLLAGLALCITALARPRWGVKFEEFTGRGRDVILAMDTSRSMLAQDLAPNRLERAKYAALDLLGELGGDRIGLVAFAGEAFLQAPLTPDHDAVAETLRGLNTEAIGQGGSNLTAAIEAAKEAFGKGESTQRALILFSDGEELEEDALEAASKYKEWFRIYTVGVGTEAGAPVLRPLRRGGAEYVRDDQGNIVTTKLDESRLQEVAKRAGGFYLRLQNGPADMRRLAREGLGNMNEKETESRTKEIPHERFEWPLAAGLLCLATSVLLGERRRLARTAALALTMISLPMPAEAKGGWLRSIARAINGGQAEEVDDAKPDDPSTRLQKIEAWREQRPGVPELDYNAGCAAFAAGEYDKAATAFSQALGTGDSALKAKAAYNLGNALARRGVKKEKEPKLADWKGAVQQYDNALTLNPADEDAKKSREIVLKAIADLERKEQEQKQDEQKKDEQKQDQKDQDQKNQDQKNGGSKDQDQKNQEQKDPQKKDRQSPKNQESQDGKSEEQKREEQRQSQQKNEQKKEGDAKDGKPQPGQEPPEKPNPGDALNQAQPGEKDPKKPGEGKLERAGNPGENKDAQEAAEAAKAAREGRMTERDARALLDAMRKYDQVLPPLQQLERRQTRPRGGKDW